MAIQTSFVTHKHTNSLNIVNFAWVMIFKNILGTTGTRILNAIFNLLVLLMITHLLGRGGLGEISLIVVDITVIQLIIDLLAGSALVYFASRTEISRLLIPAYLWVLLVMGFIVVVFQFVFHFLPAVQTMVIPEGYTVWILFLALLNGFMQIHYNLLMGLNKIKTYNIIFTIQITLFITAFSFFMLMKKQYSVLSYVQALSISWIISGLFGFIVLSETFRRSSFHRWYAMVGKIFRYGILVQGANVLHIGNKRLSYYLVRIYSGFASLGVLSAGVQLTEGLRLIGQSISLVQFSAISNSRSSDYSKLLTIKSMKFSLTITFLALTILLIMPTNAYTYIFGNGFGEIKFIVFALSPGVIALAANTIFSHYFSGMGNPKVNLWANVTGFIVTLVLAFTLIPRFGYMGAALTASFSYFTSVVYQYIVFQKQTGTRWKEWILKKEDIEAFIQTGKVLFNSQKEKSQRR